jgi:hypothetical protein
MKFPCVVIHRSQDTEREPLITDLETALGTGLSRYEAIDGNTLYSLPRRHPHETVPTTLGALGCVASHVDLLRSAFLAGESHILIFEDDACMEPGADVVGFIRGITQPYDLLFLGVNQVVDGVKEGDLWRVRRFWGTHAVLCTQKAMRAIMDEYEETVRLGYAYPSDWLYARAIQTAGLIALAPVKNLCSQKKGLVSVITGKVRR